MQGLRWQFELHTADQINDVIGVCRANDLDHEVIVERGGERFFRRIAAVTSPNGVTVRFEGTNEAHTDG